jgi:hypothetical protein
MKFHIMIAKIISSIPFKYWNNLGILVGMGGQVGLFSMGSLVILVKFERYRLSMYGRLGVRLGFFFTLLVLYTLFASIFKDGLIEGLNEL